MHTDVAFIKIHWGHCRILLYAYELTVKSFVFIFSIYTFLMVYGFSNLNHQPFETLTFQYSRCTLTLSIKYAH